VTTRLIVLMLLFVVVGTPMVYVLWSFVNEVLTGHFDSGLALLALPVLAVFAGLLVFLGRWARREAE
jgi:polyferredoxin